ncbi:MAG TPA: formate dehydrogenase accessory sulfurtransferase FdhD, partial [Polyangiaceae bacterium]
MSSPAASSIASASVERVSESGSDGLKDWVAVEEPLEIRLVYGPPSARTAEPMSVTMRTPGHDPELAAGFLFSEGILRHPDQIREIESSGPHCNVVTVSLAPSVLVDIERLRRHFYTTSSCGVCGKTSIEALRTQRVFDSGDELVVSAALVKSLPFRLGQAQEVFEKTGGLHATGLFDQRGELLVLREDVGRHNAMDKIIGHAFFQKRLPLHGCIALVSGRASFELVQKVAMAGVPLMAAVGAPSSLAI